MVSTKNVLFGILTKPLKKKKRCSDWLYQKMGFKKIQNLGLKKYKHQIGVFSLKNSF